MKARPILFSAPMVRALLDGRKTQTRREISLKDRIGDPHHEIDRADAKGFYPGKLAFNWRCPYGKPGDLLYVRETWAHSNLPLGPLDDDCGVFFRADYLDDPLGPDLERASDGIRRRWLPSIHLPRSRSRVTLCLTDIRVERLQEISEADAIAEGIENSYIPGHGRIAGSWKVYTNPKLGSLRARGSYQSLWESINGPISWDSNPWVWVVCFEVIHKNVDELLEVAA